MLVKIARPDVQLPTDPQAIAGNSCDLTKVLELLAIIRSRIGSVNEPPERRTVLSTLGDPVELGPNLNIVRKLILMQHDFTGVFTSLEDIHVTLTECCTDIAGIFTVLNSLNLSATLICDLSGVFTELADIKQSLTTCCADLSATITTCCGDLTAIFTTFHSESVNGIFTVLSEIKSTLTECCADIQADIAGIFTVLEDIHFTLTECCADLKQSITTCCAAITINFAGTFTVLEDIRSTMTECCADIAGIFTALNNVTVVVDLTGIFTTLADIKSTLTTCCSILEADFAGNFTVLADIKQSLTTCCFVLEQDFAGVFTVLADIKETITECCSDISGIFTVLTDIAETVTECCADILANYCNPTLIRQADFGPGGTTPYTISTAGVYKLAEDIIYNGAAGTQAVIISASNVTYDQQCFTLQQGNSSPTVDAVRVNSGLTDVIIKNGKIQNFTRAGVSIQDNIDRLKILDLTVLNCAVRGIELLGPSSVLAPTIAEALIQNVDVLLSATFAASGNNALLMQGCLDTKIKNCRFNENGITSQNISVVRLDNCFKCSFENIDSNDNVGNILHVMELNSTTSACTFEGCSLKSNRATGDADGFILIANSNCSSNEFINCEVLLLTGTSAVDAFLTSTNCNNNIFINCRALVNNATGADAVAIAHGFNFIANAFNSCIDCIANGNSAVASTASPLPAAGAVGFEFNTTTSCSLIRCIALDNTTGASSSSIGFKVFFGNRNGLRECQGSRNTVGFYLDPNNTTNHALTRNVALKNIRQYIGFIAGSTQNSATISNINGTLGNPWTNIAIG